MTAVAEMLEKMRASRAQLQNQLAQITEEQMTLPVPRRPTPTRVRSIFYSLVSHQAEHTVHLVKTLNALGIAQSEAQLILRDLQASRGRLEGLLTGLSDGDLDREPAEGEWSPRRVLEHIIEAEELFLSRVQEALAEATAS